MRKMRLELDALHVESFVPAEQPAARGTVHGMASLYWEDCSPSDTCPGAWPCDASQQSCGGTCYENTCHPGCGGGGSAGCSGGCSAVTWCYVGSTCIDQPDTSPPNC